MPEIKIPEERIPVERIHLFPHFTEKKISVRICLTKYADSPIKVMSVSKDAKGLMNSARSNSRFYLDLPNKTIVISNSTDDTLGQEVDLSTQHQPWLARTLNVLGMKQGVTYFGEQLTERGETKIIFKVPDLERIVTKNFELLERYQIPVLR